MTVFENLVVVGRLRPRPARARRLWRLRRGARPMRPRRQGEPAGRRAHAARPQAARARTCAGDAAARAAARRGGGRIDRARMRRAGRPDPRRYARRACSIVWIEHVVHALTRRGRPAGGPARRHASSPKATRTRSSAARPSPKSTWGFPPTREANEERNDGHHQANDLLEPGYLPFESGYGDLGDGRKVVAALTRMPGCRAKMVHWWFSWLGGTDQYKLWHPRDHLFSDWENRHRRQVYRRRASGA